MWYVYTLPFLLPLLLPPRLTAQPQNPTFKHLRKGLAQHWVISIVQDSRGFMWFGTSGGLSRFDGLEFKNYENVSDDSTSLSDNNVNCLYVDSRGNLWIGTIGGLGLYDRRRDSFIRYSWPRVGSQLNSVYSLCEDDSARLWLGTNGGLRYLDRDKDVIETYEVYNSHPAVQLQAPIRGLSYDNQGILWIGNERNQVFLLNRQEETLEELNISTGTTKAVEQASVYGIIQDATGDIWMATLGNGIIRATREKGGDIQLKHFLHDPDNPNSLSSNRIISMQFDRSGRLWIGIENRGLSIFDPRTEIYQHIDQDPDDEKGISSKTIYAIYRDINDRMWLGTFDQGINVFDPYDSKFRNFTHSRFNDNSLSYNNVTCFMEDNQGNLWIGTDGGGLDFYNRHLDQFTHYKHDPDDPNSLSSDAVLSLYLEAEDNIWIATWEGGVSILAKDRKTFRHLKAKDGLASNYIFSIADDQEGRRYFATFFGGLSIYDPRTREFTNYRHDPLDNTSLSIQANHLYQVYRDRSDRIWLGTVGAGLDLLKRDPSGKVTFTNYYPDSQVPGRLLDGQVNMMFEDSRGRFWVGTRKGLNLMNRQTGYCKTYLKKDGLPDNNVVSMLEDDRGNLWVGTSKGLAKFEPDLEQFTVLDHGDGIVENQFNKNACLQLRDGSMVFGGSNGFVQFHPDSVKPNANPPQVYLTDFKVFNERVKVGGENSPLPQQISEMKELILSPEHSVISFDFIALNYTHPEENQYAFMLEGLEKDWNYVGNRRSVTYSNLYPGKYVFRVKAANNDGVWNPLGTALRITVVPPYWQTWWLRGLIACTIGLLLFGGYRVRVRTIRSQKEKLESQVLTRTSELEEKKSELEQINSQLERVNQFKSEFLANMSHEIRTPMNSIIGMTELALEAASDETEKEYLRIVSSAADGLLELINDILDFSKIEVGQINLEHIPFDIRDVVENVCDILSIRCELKGLELAAYVDPQVHPWVLGDPTRLRQILVNLGGNAIKFTETGQVCIKVEPFEEVSNVLTRQKAIGLHFQVQDTGIGIPEEALSHIFEKFTQADTSTTRQYGGTGLGLSISRSLVELMDGRIWVTSRSGEGSNFQFTLHLEAAKGDALENRKPHHSDFGGRSVLVVEDNPGNCELLEKLLTAWNMRVTLATNEQSAIEIISGQASGFDLAILDYHAPGLKSPELVRALQRQRDKKKTRVILLSSLGALSAKRQQKIGANCLLTTPIKQSRLLGAVKECFEQTPEKQCNKLEVVSGTQATTARGNCRILLVEDNPDNQKLAITILEKAGYVVEVAENGKQAVDAAQRANYDVILMDVHMPVMDGFQATRAIREHENAHGDERVPIVALTAHAIQNYRQKCLDNDMDDFITKPLNRKRLLERIAEWTAAGAPA